jgi:hypothetical protein
MSLKRELILNSITDLVSNFLYYDRKEDEELKIGDIENCIKNNELTIEEMVKKFKFELEKNIK